MAFTFNHNFGRMIDFNSPPKMIIDSFPFFGVLTKGRVTTEEQLIIDLKPAKDA